MKRRSFRRILPVAVSVCLLSSTAVFAMSPATAKKAETATGRTSMPSVCSVGFGGVEHFFGSLAGNFRWTPVSRPSNSRRPETPHFLPCFHFNFPSYCTPVSKADTTAPSTWYNSPSNEQVLGADGTISIVAHDDVGIAKIRITVPGTAFVKTVDVRGAKDDTVTLAVKDLGLPDGFHTLRTVVTDTSGNVSGNSDRNFVIDTAAPALSSVTFGSVPVQNGVVLTGSNVFTARFTEANPQRTYVEVDELVNGKWSKVAGSWSTGSAANAATLAVDTKSLKQYTQYQLKISCDDLAGNHTGYAASFTVDTTAPSTWYNSPSDEQVLGANGAISIGAHDDVALASIKVTVPGTAFAKTVDGIGAKDDTLTLAAKDLGLPDGFYTLRTVVTDTAGNVSVTSDRNFVIDTAAPALSSVTFGSVPVQNGVVLTGSNVFTARFTEANPQRTYVEVDELVNGKWSKVAGNWSTGSAANAATLAVDTKSLKQYTQYQLKVSCDDLAGNHTGYAASFTVDTTAPSTWYNSPAEQQVLGANGAISIGAHDDVALASMKVTVPGTAFAKTVDGIGAKDDTVTLAVKDLGLPDGSYTLRTVVTDTAGNVSGNSDRSFVIDTAAPALSSVTFGSVPVQNGVVLAGSDVFTARFSELHPERTYVEVDQLVNGKWSKVAGSWSNGDAANAATLAVDTASLSPAAPYQLKITSDDTVGNRSSFSIAFTVDNGGLR